MAPTTVPPAPPPISTPLKTIVVLGAAYGGARAAQLLANAAPEGWRVVVIDRNTHINHVYTFPRYSVLLGHEHKAFIPTRNIFQLPDPSAPSPHIVLHAQVESFSQNHIVLSRAFPEFGIHSATLHYDYAVYALGAQLPDPVNLRGPRLDPREKDKTECHGTKAEGTSWLQSSQKVIAAAGRVLVVGGGALGIQLASDIADVYPMKKVTLLHSRRRLLPKYDEGMHVEIVQSLTALNVEMILGERLDMNSVDNVNDAGQRIVRTESGKEIAADLLLLCTGQIPNTALLKEMDPSTMNPENSLAHVLRSLQLGSTPVSEEEVEDTPYGNIFVIGDAADAFGAIQAGHNAYAQADVAAKNILKLISGSGKNELERYTPSPPSIKVSVGIAKRVYQVNGAIKSINSGVEDMLAKVMWPKFGIEVKDDADMYE
ncbi:FAD/NAD(P)-binding domain-containing protein [Guyanagaster necrorhizus]|uniref:FAD/NAD(P)-binding domain-containing protein n=1 Tax=Guyanagaster necrorhizus TaxID=856835 RepID=A0A9P7W0G0_9AGAR|nr:FAD/NAD(P)-binding domain-containing protein [Guyanagaster necrorhizus MCA 3950]KAG7449907.1 FAD/NAD(P)-binding domain-containing protein [Guyanagaster necrorhizus MCA 3950]